MSRRSHGRHCRRCLTRIPRRARLCPVCRAANLKAVDYVMLALLAAALILAYLYFGNRHPGFSRPNTGQRQGFSP